MTAMIGLYPTCLGDAVHPQVVRDARRVLRAAGADPVPIPGATCCGQPAWNSGFAADARRVARRTLHAMAEAILDRVEAIAEIHIAMPNRHCLLVDLSPFGMDNPNEVFLPVDEPHGLIEATLTRG